MAVKTSNYYGKITVTDNAVAMVAHYAAMDCYGSAIKDNSAVIR